jgi:hypothetical protein
MPAVDRGVRAIARGADGCPVELTGSGIVTQGPGGVYVADGSVNKSICLPNLAASNTPNALLGLTASQGSLCYRQLTGDGMADAGKVLKWDGVAFVLKSLLESLCYPASVVQNTCCPGEGIAVWGQTGSSLCLQQWNPCEDQTQKAVSNPKFVGCENGTMVAFNLCDLPIMVAGTEYQQVVCTADGPRVLGTSGGVSARQFIPFDVLGSGTPIVLDSAPYNDSGGSSISIPVNLAADTGVAIPSGATHVMVLINIVLDNDDSDAVSVTLYSPASVSAANWRGYMVHADAGSDMTLNVTYNVPISADAIGVLLQMGGTSSDWDMEVTIRIEGYWVG